jgi:hypothetical protein
MARQIPYPNGQSRPGGVTSRTKQRAPGVSGAGPRKSLSGGWAEDILKQVLSPADWLRFTERDLSTTTVGKPPTQPDLMVGRGRWRKSVDTSLRELERFVRSPGKRATEGQVRRGAAEIARRRRKQLRDRGWFMERVPVYNAEGKAVGTTFKRRKKEVPIKQGALRPRPPAGWMGHIGPPPSVGGTPRSPYHGHADSSGKPAVEGRHGH